MHRAMLESILTGIFFAVFAFLAFLIPMHPITSGWIAFSFVWFGHLIGERAFSHTPRGIQLGGGICLILAVQSLYQTTLYYLHVPLTDTVCILTTLAAILSLLMIRLFPESKHNISPTTPRADITMMWSLIFFGCLAGLSTIVIRYAALSGTTESIRTPWSVMPHAALAAISAAWICAFALAWFGQRVWLSTIGAMFTMLSVTSITSLIYTLGYGFDGFLHRASERVLFTTGILEPQPFYYIGQYVLVNWFAHLTGTLSAVDTWLVPCAAILIPICPSIAFWDSEKPRTSLFIGAGTLLLVPLTPFITTTPQSFAYIVGLIAIACAWQPTSWLTRLVGSLFAAWSVAIHPLAGLPIFALVIALIASHYADHAPTITRAIRIVGIIVSTCSIPVAFFLNGQSSSHAMSWHWERLINPQAYRDLLTHMLPSPINHIAAWADWAVIIQTLTPFALFFLAITGLITAPTKRRTSSTLLIGSVLLTCAGAMLYLTGDFSFLIEYERNNYTDRLFTLAEILLLFPALVGWHYLAERIIRKPMSLVLGLLLGLSAWFGGRVYGAFPRHDAASTSHGWSVGQADKTAVRYIDQDAKGMPYTVLANQTVSAAAVDILGFRRYAGDVFFYPLPTGGPLYGLFLEVMKPASDRTAVQQAASLGQSKLVYVVLNEYWWNAERVDESLRALADHVYEIENGKTRVYRFDIQ